MSRISAQPCSPPRPPRHATVEPLAAPTPPPARPGSGRAIGRLGLGLVGLLGAIAWLSPGEDEPPARPPGAVQEPVAVVGSDLGAADPSQARRLSEAMRRARASAVSVEYVTAGAVPTRRVASGVVINDQGDLLSIRIDAPERRDQPGIIATDAQGHRHPVRWLAADADTGLTLLRLPAGAVPPVRLAANEAALGTEVFLVGNPYGLGHSISRGHVGGLGRRLNLAGRAVAGLIQVQASVHPGDSGAPLADLNGGWLGLVRGGLELPQPGAGRGDDLAFVIPARDALWVADQLRASGRVNRAFLGLRLAADAALKTLILPNEGPPAEPSAGAGTVGGANVDPEAGAQVAAIIPGSPAAHAHLQPGDRVVRLDDRPIARVADLTDRLEWTAADAQVALEYIRGTALHRIILRAGTRPNDSAPPDRAASPTSGGRSTPLPTLLPVPPAPATPDEATLALIRSLQERVDQLERRLGDLERERGRPTDSPAASPVVAPH